MCVRQEKWEENNSGNEEVKVYVMWINMLSTRLFSVVPFPGCCLSLLHTIPYLFCHQNLNLRTLRCNHPHSTAFNMCYIFTDLLIIMLNIPYRKVKYNIKVVTDLLMLIKLSRLTWVMMLDEMLKISPYFTDSTGSLQTAESRSKDYKGIQIYLLKIIAAFSSSIQLHCLNTE